MNLHKRLRAPVTSFEKFKKWVDNLALFSQSSANRDTRLEDHVSFYSQEAEDFLGSKLPFFSEVDRLLTMAKELSLSCSSTYS